MDLAVHVSHVAAVCCLQFLSAAKHSFVDAAAFYSANSVVSAFFLLASCAFANLFGIHLPSMVVFNAFLLIYFWKLYFTLF